MGKRGMRGPLGLLGGGHGEINVVCPAIVPTVGPAELLSNVEFTVNTVGWTSANGGVLTRRDYTAAPAIAPTGGMDDFGLEVASGGNPNSAARQLPASTIGEWYQTACRAYSPSGNTSVNVASLRRADTPVVETVVVTGEDAWQTLLLIGRTIAAQLDVRLVCASATAGDLAHFDAISAMQLVFSTCHVPVDKRNVLAGIYVCRPTVAAGTVAGFLIHYADENNFVMALVDRPTATARLVSRIAGAYASVGSGAVAYAAGADLKITVDTSGNYSLDYAGVNEVAPVAIAQATLGRWVHGFNTYAGNLVGLVSTSKN